MKQKWTPTRRQMPPDGEQVLVAWANTAAMVAYAQGGKWYAALQVPDGRGLATIVVLPSAPSLWRPIPENPLVMRVEEVERLLAGPQPGDYRCVVCGENPVDAEGGYDTCPACLKRA